MQTENSKQKQSTSLFFDIQPILTKPSSVESLYEIIGKKGCMSIFRNSENDYLGSLSEKQISYIILFTILAYSYDSTWVNQEESWEINRNRIAHELYNIGFFHHFEFDEIKPLVSSDNVTFAPISWRYIEKQKDRNYSWFMNIKLVIEKTRISSIVGETKLKRDSLYNVKSVAELATLEDQLQELLGKLNSKYHSNIIAVKQEFDSDYFENESWEQRLKKRGSAVN